LKIDEFENLKMDAIFAAFLNIKHLIFKFSNFQIQ